MKLEPCAVQQSVRGTAIVLFLVHGKLGECKSIATTYSVN